MKLKIYKRTLASPSLCAMLLNGWGQDFQEEINLNAIITDTL